MNKNELDLLFWGLPILGGFLGFIINKILIEDQYLAVCVMLGLVCGYIALLCYILIIKMKYKND